MLGKSSPGGIEEPSSFTPLKQYVSAVVGVAADVRQRRLDQQVQPMIYAPFQQERSGFVRFVAFVARTAAPASVAEGIRAELRRAAPYLPIGALASAGPVQRVWAAALRNFCHEQATSCFRARA